MVKWSKDAAEEDEMGIDVPQFLVTWLDLFSLVLHYLPRAIKDNTSAKVGYSKTFSS